MMVRRPHLRWRREARLRRDLTRLHAFSLCSRRELHYIAKWGELLEVDPGQVIVRQDRGDYWFFVVVAGSVHLTRDGAPLATLHPGSHCGEWTVVGLRPQPTTAVAGDRSVLFVLGPRYVLSLLALSQGFQRAMFPDIAPADYPDFARRMNQLGRDEWHRLDPARPIPSRPSGRRPSGVTSAPSRPDGLEARLGELRRAERLPGRSLSLAEAAMLLARHQPDGEVLRLAPYVPRPSSRWRRVAGGLGAGAIATLALVLYHPPRVVVTAGQPIDVVGDIRVSGAPVHRPSGRYLLLWVRETQPDLAGFLWALVRQRRTVAVNPLPSTTVDRAAVEVSGRRQYLDSQRSAIRAAVAAAGVDPHRISVQIRDRGLVGPSAGLVYALALDDLLTGRDLTHGEAVAVTGALDPDGRVDPVGWVSVKAQGADEAGAQELLVPPGEGADARAWMGHVHEVADLAQAIQVLVGAERRTPDSQ